MSASEPLATFWEQLTPGTTYVRCTLPARHLPGVSLRFDNVDVRLAPDGEPVYPRQEGSVAVWQFVGDRLRGYAMAGMQEAGIRVLMEVDDNYLVPHPVEALRSAAWKPGLDELRQSGHEAHRRISEFCDGVVVATPYLAEVYRTVNPNVYVCPNAVDPADWPEPQPYDGTLRIGWAASDSHLVDAPLVRRALRWASKQPDVEVVLYGNLFRRLRHSGEWDFHFRSAPWTNNLTDYRHNLGFLDVALCPLKDNEWSKGKSDVKALEAAMAGALPIVSRAEAYRPWWEGGLPCLVAETAKGFEEAVRWCVNHRDEVQEKAAEARAYVLAERAFPQAAEPWRQMVRAMTPKPRLYAVAG